MRKIRYIIMILFLLGIFVSCKNGRKPDTKSFFDNLKTFPMTFFDLLDPYPAIKDGFTVINPSEFNIALDFSLREDAGTSAPSLRALQIFFLDQSYGLRETLSEGAELIRRIRTKNSSSYNTFFGWIEKVRSQPLRIIYTAAPLTHFRMDEIFRSRGDAAMKDKADWIISVLGGSSIKTLVNKAEDVSFKALVLNSTFRGALEHFFSFLWDPSISNDKKVKTLALKMVDDFGSVFGDVSGIVYTKSPDIIIKRMILNLKNHFTPGGAVYENAALTTHGVSVYKNTKYPSELKYQLAELYSWVKDIVIPPSELVKNTSVSIAEGLMKNLALIGFSRTTQNLDKSIRDWMNLDLLGMDRFYTVGSDMISSLETLLFMLGTADAFGYEWNETITTVARVTDMAQATRTGGPKGGRLSLLDAAFSMYSNLTGNIGLINIVGGSKTDQTVASAAPGSGTVKVFRDDQPYVITVNTPALSLLEGESRGEAKSAADSIYTKTIPWALSWISKVVYSGYGPFYNKNRKNSAGNYTVLDGSVYKLADKTDLIYKTSWRTSQYRILSRLNTSWAGIGGAAVSDAGRLTTADPEKGTTPWVGKSYLIPEITYADAQRASDSDEEAMYRNFQWLMYEKRFVLTIPMRTYLASTDISAVAGVPFNDAIFVVVIANGLKGLMSAKPFCGFTKCDALDNGKWLLANQPLKTDYTQPGALTYFSNLPGDSVIQAEVWGYGVQPLAGGTFSFLDPNIFTTVYNSILYTKATQPDQFYGPIPPVISQLFPSIELLGFLKDNRSVSSAVTPSLVGTYWDRRNRVLPFVAALAKTLYEQTDRTSNKNAFEYLGRLTDILLRPFVLQAQEPLARTADPAVPEFKLFKIRGATDAAATGYSMRSPNLGTTDYYPHQLELQNSDSRSIVSFLIEDERRQSDGILNLLAKRNLLSASVSLLSELGRDERTQGRQIAVSALQALFPEIEVSVWDRTNPLNVTETYPSNPIRFNLQESINSVENDIIHYTDSRSSDITDSSWDEINDITDFIYTYLSPESKYTVSRNISAFYDVLLSVRPSSAEISSMFEMAASVLSSDSGTKDYLVSRLLNERTPRLLSAVSKYARPLIGTVRGLLRDDGFFIFLEDKMKTSYTLQTVLEDTERLLNASIIQERKSFYESLFISAGALMKYLADVTEKGWNTPDKDPYHDFYDNKNREDKMSSYHQRVNLILSKKN